MAEVPHLVKMQEEFAGNRFSVVGLMKGDAQKASGFIREKGINYPVLADSPDFGAYDVLFLPVTYLVDPAGNIVTDDLDEADAILRRELDS